MEKKFPGENGWQLQLSGISGDEEREVKVSGNSSIVIKSECFQLQNCLVKITETIMTLLLCLYPTGFALEEQMKIHLPNMHLNHGNDIKSERQSMA